MTSLLLLHTAGRGKLLAASADKEMDYNHRDRRFKKKIKFVFADVVGHWGILGLSESRG